MQNENAPKYNLKELESKKTSDLNMDELLFIQQQYTRLRNEYIAKAEYVQKCINMHGVYERAQKTLVDMSDEEKVIIFENLKKDKSLQAGAKADTEEGKVEAEEGKDVK